MSATMVSSLTLPGGRCMGVDAEGFAAQGWRPSSARRSFLAAWLWGQADNACTVCGESTSLTAMAGDPTRAIVMHLVPSGPNRMGWLPGNVISACEACNSADGGRNLLSVAHLFARGVPTAWAQGETYTRSRADYGPEFERRRVAREALGLPY